MVYFPRMSDSNKNLTGDMETRRCGAGWKRKSKKSGKPYISVVLDRDLKAEERLLVFPNGFKTNEKSPDYMLYLQDNDYKGQSEPKQTESVPEEEEMLT